MITTEKIGKLLQIIEEKSKLETYAEEGENSSEGYFDAQDASGDNFDDAYGLGQEDGKIEFARQLMKLINE